MPPKPTTVARVTRSSARLVARSNDAPSAAVSTVASTVATTEAPPPAKKRRTAAPKKTPTKPVPAAVPVAAPQAPPIAPPPFSLPEAIAHLSAVDRRFTSLFERIPCRPFVEAADGQSAASAGAAVAAATAEAAASASPSNEAAQNGVVKDEVGKDKGPAELVQREVDPFRTLVTSIIGQQVSWMAARSITKRFVELFCGPVGDVQSRKTEGPFPTREQVAKSDVAMLKGVGFSTRKAEYVIGLAQDFVAGRLTDDLLINGTDAEVADALIAVRGIGRWTVDMFLIFTLRRPDVLPVGDLGVQKGLLRWVLAAHGALPEPPTPKTPKTPKSKKGTEPATPTPGGAGTPLGPSDSTATLIDVPSTPTKQTPTLKNSLETPSKLIFESALATPSKFPSTPGPPPVTPNASTNPALPRTMSDSILATPHDWTNQCAHRAAPLPDGLNVATLRSRLAGKKAKGGVYLLPAEMEALTDAWKPYRSLGVYYTWTMAGESPNTSAP